MCVWTAARATTGSRTVVVTAPRRARRRLPTARPIRSASTTPARAGRRASLAGTASPTSVPPGLHSCGPAWIRPPERLPSSSSLKEKRRRGGSPPLRALLGARADCRHPRAQEERTSRAVSARTSETLRAGKSGPSEGPATGAPSRTIMRLRLLGDTAARGESEMTSDETFMWGGLRARLEKSAAIRPRTIPQAVVGQRPERIHRRVHFHAVRHAAAGDSTASAIAVHGR